MDSVFFPAKIRRFVKPDIIEAEIDLYFGVFTRRNIMVGGTGGGLSVSDLTHRYKNQVVYVQVDRPGMRADTLNLPVFERNTSNAYIPFRPGVM